MGQIGDAAYIEVARSAQGSVAVEVPLRNIGTGPAVITKAGLSVTQLHDEATRLSIGIVAVGEVVRMSFDIQSEGATLKALHSALSARQPFVVTVFYGDQGGTGSWRSRVYVHVPPKDNRYEVDRVELFAGDANTPFASTRPQ
jgi:hypothetical protein